MHLDRPAPAIRFYGEWKSTKKARILPRHKNDGLEIVLLARGEVRWMIEDRIIPLKAGTFFYTLPWQEHGGVEDVQPNCEISYLCLRLAESHDRPRRRFRFHPALGFLPAEDAALSSVLTAHPTQAIAGDDACAWLLGHLAGLLREKSPLRRSRIRDTIKLLLGSLASLAAATPQTAQPRSHEAERRVGAFVDTLIRRHAEPWTLASMSAACRLGRTQFAELLKKRTGDSPVTYLNRLRIGEAGRLLQSSDRPITDIALDVGFNSSQYFATVFRQFTAMEARQFRARRRFST